MILTNATSTEVINTTTSVNIGNIINKSKNIRNKYIIEILIDSGYLFLSVIIYFPSRCLLT